MAQAVAQHKNPWALPPLPLDFDRRLPKLTQGWPGPKRINRLMNLSLGCSAAFLCLVFPIMLSQSVSAQDGGGWQLMVVTGDAMEPAICSGALTLVRKTPFDRLREGDIIVFARADGRLHAQRIISLQRGGAFTKGDRVPLPESAPVTPEMYRCQVLKVFNGFSSVTRALTE